VRHTFLIVLPSLATMVACAAADSEVPPQAPPPPPPVAVAPPPPPGPIKPAYPAAEKRPVVDTYGDVRVTDDYRWLEDWSDPNVKAWSEAENAFARKWLDAGQSREAIRARVAALMGDTSPSWSGLTARRGVFFALERRPPKQQSTLIVLKSLDDTKTSRVLVDPTVIDPTGSTSIGWFAPSPDGTRVAVSLAKAGAEHGDVHVFDVATGKDGKDAVPQADGAGSGECLAWNRDGTGFYYTRGRPDGASPNAYRHISFHKLGDAPDKDADVLGQDGPRIAQWEVATGSDRRTVVARVEDGDSGHWEHWVLGAAGKWVRVATREDSVKRVVVGTDGSLFFVSSKDAPKRKLLRTSSAAQPLAKADVVVPEGAVVLADVLPTQSRLYLLEDTGGVSRLRSAPLSNGKAGAPALIVTPPISAIGGLEGLGGDDIAFASTSYTQPIAVYRVSAKDGAVTKTALAATSAADYSGVEVTREECTSKDGTKVPITVLHSRSSPPNGTAQALLTGYGGFGNSLTPRFRAHTIAWLEQGGVYAVANLRGGSELGEAWHTGGNLTNKQNVFDDMYGCAQHLVDAKYTSPARLAIQGGSNGGLLMGAELTQHPEAWKAVVSMVGIYDMLRVERDANGAFNVTEYGSVADSSQFAALYAYSPYQHVKDSTAYPATLFMTGANDPRVAPYHSRKMVARLQAATSSDAPILLRTSANTGHGMGTPLAAQIEETTDVYTFLFLTLGVTYSPK
jgi:prolyl oligopeptidase